MNNSKLTDRFIFISLLTALILFTPLAIYAKTFPKSFDGIVLGQVCTSSIIKGNLDRDKRKTTAKCNESGVISEIDMWFLSPTYDLMKLREQLSKTTERTPTIINYNGSDIYSWHSQSQFTGGIPLGVFDKAACRLNGQIDTHCLIRTMESKKKRMPEREIKLFQTSKIIHVVAIDHLANNILWQMSLDDLKNSVKGQSDDLETLFK